MSNDTRTALSAPAAAPDWADIEAAVHLRYLDKCGSEAEQREYLACLLRKVEAQGACRASAQMSAVLIGKVPEK